MRLSMQGRLSKCLLLAYRTPAESVRPLLPAGLELMTHGPWAFWNVVICEVERMRPAGLPAVCGVSYRHAAYRLYVKAATQSEGRLRGLHFVRSDADHCLVARGGNVMSDFRFHPAKIDLAWREDRIDVKVVDPRHETTLALEASPGEARLAEDSCFASLEEARSMLKYQPLGLSVSRNGRWLRLAEVFRDEHAWRETPMEMASSSLRFFDAMGQKDVHLELATQVAPLDYRWRLGRRVRLATAHDFSTGSPASFHAR